MLAPPQRREATRRRQARHRARQRSGIRVYPLPLTDVCVENLILRFILNGKLTEAQAMQAMHLNRALADLIEEIGRA
jgi:hypothetical protein